ncbi:hypothetical protein AB3X52_12105 [Nocardioides sp. DS6]|uniref:Thiolase C-terminal domain-containing protein n=1 Tax=Nocardioides eburneus TaxID=3231482 RepID=A0ABV3T277_9ACTN
MAETHPLRGQVSIAGFGETAFGKNLPGTAWELAVEASLKAMEAAGVEPEEVDGIARFCSPLETVTTAAMVRGLGLRELSFFTECPLGGEALGAVLGQAASAILAGQASTVLVYRALSQSKGGRFGRADRGLSTTDDVIVPTEDNTAFAWPYGLVSPANLFAMMATRYMHEHHVTPDQMAQSLGSVALAQRAYANNNPRAMMRDRPLTMDTYLDARMISWPLRLFDLCLENDGAVAFILTSSERAKRLRTDGEPVQILAATQSLAPYHEPFGIYTPDMTRLYPDSATERLYRNAGVTPERIKVAEMYDASSFMTVGSLESFGLVPRGEGWRHVAEKGIGLDSPLPTNTHGGHLSEAYIHGLNAVTEAMRQLRGVACNQVAGADVAIVGGASGTAVILGV